MTPNEAMGEVIRNGRATRRLSQQELAEKLGWTQRKISLIESGKQPIDLNEVAHIARVLGSDPVKMVIESYQRSRRSV